MGILRQRPFVPLVLLLAGGILTSRVAGLELGHGVLGLCGAAALFLRLRLWAVAAAVFFLGTALYSWRYEILSGNDVRLIVGEKPALVSVRALLLETPTVREFPGRTNSAVYSYARLQVTEVLSDKEWRAAAGTIATVTPGVFDPEWFKGRQVEVAGVIDLPNRAAAPGLFDFRNYLFNQRVFYQLRCESTNDWRLTSFDRMPLTERFQRWAHVQLSRGLPGEDEPLEMVRAMALGRTQSLSGEMADVFMRTGTMHIFAISGLHVACIAACVLAFLRVGGVPRDRAAFILIALVWFYTLATGWQSSAVRSALMSTFVFAGWALRRPTELINSTAGAALLILLVEPEQLFQASFQLSFVVVTAIALLLGRSHSDSWMARAQDRILRYDPLLPPELRPKWKQWLEVPLKFLLGNIAISLASWIGSSALTAYYFNVVTPISLLANLVAVPLSSVSLAATLGSLLLPPSAPVFNYLSWATMWETIVVTRWFAEISWGYFYVPKPNVWLLLTYFGIILFCAVPVLRRPRVRLVTLSALAVSVSFLITSAVLAGRSTTVTLLAAPGNPLFVNAPGGKSDILVGCSNLRGAEQSLKRFLRAHGIGRLKNLVLPHGMVDAVGGFETIHAEFQPNGIFATLLPGRSRPYKQVLARLEKVPGVRKISSGDRVADWSVLGPSTVRNRGRADDSAIVLRGELYGWRILHLGALGNKGQQELIESDNDLKTDILIMDSPVALIRTDLLERTCPRVVILGADDKPFQRRDDSAVRKQLAACGIPVFTTGNREAVTLRVRVGVCEVEKGGASIFFGG